jgi:hypothetical protein
MADPSAVKKVADALKSGATEEQILRVIAQSPELRDKITDEDVRYIARKHLELTGGPKPAGEIQRGRTPEIVAQELVKSGPGYLSQAMAAARGIVAPTEEEANLPWSERAARAAERQGQFVQKQLGAPVTPTGPAEELAALTGRAAGLPATMMGAGTALRGLPFAAKAGEFLAAAPFSQFASSLLGEAAGEEYGPVVGVPAGLIAGFLLPGAGKKTTDLLRRDYKGMSEGEKKAAKAIVSVAQRLGYTRQGLIDALDRMGPNSSLSLLPGFRQELLAQVPQTTEKGTIAGEKIVPKLEQTAEAQRARVAQTAQPYPMVPGAVEEARMMQALERAEQDIGRKAQQTLSQREKGRLNRVQQRLSSYGPVQDTERLKVALQTERQRLYEEARNTFLKQPMSDVSGINNILKQSKTARDIYNKVIGKLRKEGEYSPVLPDDPGPARKILDEYNQMKKESGQEAADQWFKWAHAGRSLQDVESEALGTKGLTVDLASRVSQWLNSIKDRNYNASGTDAALNKALAPVVDKIQADWDAVVATSPGYAAWNEKLSNLHTLEQAVENGQKAAASGANPDLVRLQLSGLTPNQKRAFQLGYSRELSQSLGRSKEAYSSLSNNATARESARLVLGDQAASDFWNFLNTEKEQAKIEAKFAGKTEKEAAELAKRYAAEWGGAKDVEQITRTQARMDALKRGRGLFTKETPDSAAYFLAGATPEERAEFERGVTESLMADPVNIGQRFAAREGNEYKKYAQVFGEDAAQRLADESRRQLQMGEVAGAGRRALTGTPPYAPTAVETAAGIAEPLSAAAVGLKGYPIHQVFKKALDFIGGTPIVRDPTARIPFASIVTDPALSREYLQSLPLPESVAPSAGSIGRKVMPPVTGAAAPGGYYTFGGPGTAQVDDTTEPPKP